MQKKPISPKKLSPDKPKAPTPSFPQEVLDATGKTAEELQAELDVKSAALDAKLSQVEEKIAEETAITTGEELDFDLDKFITEGVVFKKNIPLIPGMFLDIQSLTHEQRILAEELVVEKLGQNPPANTKYFSVLEAAILAMAVTRINNLHIPMPEEIDLGKKSFSKDEKDPMSEKRVLFEKFIKAPSEFTRALSLLYSNLGLADLLTEASLKKS